MLSDDERKRKAKGVDKWLFGVAALLLLALVGLGYWIRAAQADTARQDWTPVASEAPHKSANLSGPGGVDDRQHDRFAALDSTGWPERVREAFPVVVRESYEAGVSPFVVMGIIRKESNFRVEAVSWNGCCAGAMQVHELYSYDRQRLTTDLGYSIEAGIEVLVRKLDGCGWERMCALQAFRGWGYEPSYKHEVVALANRYREDWLNAKEEHDGTN